MKPRSAQPRLPSLRPTSARSASRWLRAQRMRRRARLTARGRVTLGLLILLPLASAGAIAWLPEPAAEPPPEVSAPPPPPRPPQAPTGVLLRLPVGSDALELPAVLAPGVATGRVGDAGVSGHLSEAVAYEGVEADGPLQVEYTLDAELTRQVFKVLRQGRVELGHVILLDPSSGRVLAYASTAPERFPPTRAYPAASLVKVITAAAALDARPEAARLPCRFSGSPYRLTPSRLDPPPRGRTVSLRKALATSNNQCFAQLAVHAVGADALRAALSRFGWLASPAAAHATGRIDVGETRYDLGRLGCGLAGARITPLHAAQLAASLAHGELVTPRWVERVLDAEGRELPLPAVAAPRRVLSHQRASELREMLVDTTTRGTARSAFRKRGGRPLLGPVKVAGKTGSLSGTDPDGRYEWFIGVAPAEAPRIAVVTLLVQGDLWWRNASQIAAEVLRRAFCAGGSCASEHADRWLRPAAATAFVPPTPARAGGARWRAARGR